MTVPVIVPEEERPAWYGGNKIPNSYLAKFMPKQEYEDMPWELRVFLDKLEGPKKEQRDER